MVLADAEGVIVVDPAAVPGLLDSAEAIKAPERRLIARFDAGRTLSDGLNLAEHFDTLTRGEPSSLHFLP